MAVSKSKGVSPSSHNRKTIEELATRYQLNPELRDIYVEGEFDWRLLNWFLRKSNISNAVIYDIDTVDIPSGLLAKYQLAEGKKERIVALAKELEKEFSTGTQVTCICDRDYDPLLANQYSSPLLLQSDFSCQEMYFLNEDCFHKYLTLVAEIKNPETRIILTGLLQVLSVLHLHRATNLSLGWGMKWIDQTKSCTFDGNSLKIDANLVTYKYLNSNNRKSDQKIFETELAKLQARITPNLLMHVTKDDLNDMLAFLIKAISNNKALNQSSAHSVALIGCIEFVILREYPLYQSLLARLTQ